MSIEAAVARSTRETCQASRLAEQTFHAAAPILYFVLDDSFDDSAARKRRSSADIGERAEAPKAGKPWLGALPRTTADGRSGVRLFPISTRQAWKIQAWRDLCGGS